MSSRISEKAAKWVEIMDRSRSEGVTTPWWEELKKCVEGNVIPSRTEGWNHPVASESRSRLLHLTRPFGLTFDFSHLRCVHGGRKPAPGSPRPTREADRLTAMGGPYLHSLYARYPMRHLISLGPNVCVRYRGPGLDELNFDYASTESLFNEVKKQYANSHLVKLALPSPPPSGVPSPTLLPRLANNPDTSGPETPPPRAQSESVDIRLTETDLESTAKFVRELAVESLIPWMGKCVLEWNEAVSLPSHYSRFQDLTKSVFSAWAASIHRPGDYPPDYSLLLDVSSARGQFRAHPPKARFHSPHTGTRPRSVLWPLFLAMPPHSLSKGDLRNSQPSLATTSLLFQSGKSSERKERVVL